MVLPDDTGRSLGLRQHAEDDLRRARLRAGRAQGPHAGREERLLLRARSGERRAHLRRSLRVHQLDQGHRQEDRPADSEPGSRVREGSEADLPGDLGRAQLAADVLRPGQSRHIHPVDGMADDLHRDLAPARGTRRGLVHGQRVPAGNVRSRRPQEPVRRPAGDREARQGAAAGEITRLPQGLRRPEPQGAVGSADRDELGRRRVVDRLRPRVPGRCVRQPQRLRRGDRQAAGQGSDQHRHARRAHQLPRGRRRVRGGARRLRRQRGQLSAGHGHRRVPLRQRGADRRAEARRRRGANAAGAQ